MAKLVQKLDCEPIRARDGMISLIKGIIGTNCHQETKEKICNELRQCLQESRVPRTLKNLP